MNELTLATVFNAPAIGNLHRLSKPPPKRDPSRARRASHVAKRSQGEPVASELRLVLAANMKSAREAAGLSQAELARRTGLSRTIIVAIEGARQNVTLATVELIAAAMGRKGADLLCKPL